MKPMTLFQPMDRLRQFAEAGVPILDDIPQLQADAKHVLDSHVLYFQRCREQEKDIWYRQDGWSHGGSAVSWRERTEELEKKLKAAESVLWMAERYAEAISEGPEVRELAAAKEIMDE